MSLDKITCVIYTVFLCLINGLTSFTYSDNSKGDLKFQITYTIKLVFHSDISISLFHEKSVRMYWSALIELE